MNRVKMFLCLYSLLFFFSVFCPWEGHCSLSRGYLLYPLCSSINCLNVGYLSSFIIDFLQLHLYLPVLIFISFFLSTPGRRAELQIMSTCCKYHFCWTVFNLQWFPSHFFFLLVFTGNVRWNLLRFSTVHSVLFPCHGCTWLPQIYCE